MYFVTLGKIGIMNLRERRDMLVSQINDINDEQTLEMLQETLAYYRNSNNSDITDGLDADQLQELTGLMQEPAEKNTTSEEAFRNLFARWGTR